MVSIFLFCPVQRPEQKRKIDGHSSWFRPRLTRTFATSETQEHSGQQKTFIVTMCFVLGVVGWTETVRGIDSDWYNNWRSLRFLFFFRRKGKEKEKVAGRRIAHHSVFQWRHPQLATCQTGRSPRINVIRRRGCFSGGGGKSWFKLRQLILKSSVLTLCPKITTKVRMPHGTNRRTMLTSKGALFHHCLVVGGLRWIENTYQFHGGDQRPASGLQIETRGRDVRCPEESL